MLAARAGVLLSLCLVSLALAEPKVLIDTRFGTDPGKVDDPSGRVSGVLPAGWYDNSSWAKVWVVYKDAAEGDRPFTRIDVTRLDDGRCQLAHALPNIQQESFLRLTLAARTPTGNGVEVGVRQVGPPYRFLWSTSPAVSRQWQTFSYDFRLGPSGQPVGVWVNLDSAGQLDLAELRLVQLSREDIAAELKAKYPDGGPPNLFRNSRLPLGLQTGWALGRDNSDGDDVVVEPDPAVVSPVARDPKLFGDASPPALRIQAGEPMELYTEPFPIALALDTHTASLYVRGRTRLKLSVVCDGGTLASQDFPVDSPDGWTRLHLSFKPRLLAKSYGLRLEGQGTFWIDALQAASGALRPYAGQLPCEVALALPKSDASVARVQFDDEPAAVRFQVTGPPLARALKLRVADVYGDEREIALKLEPPWSGTQRYDGLFPERPYGPFRVEAWAEDADGKRVSPVNELVVYRLRRPRYWGKDAPNSPFGVHTNSTTRHNLMAKAIGINWTRLHDAGLPYLGWYHLERKKGEWTFYDKEIRRYRRDGIKVLGCLSTAPEWASTYPGRAVNGYFDRFYQPRHLEDYANYVRTVAERYKGVIDAWDIWNEPWIYAWWPVAHDPQKGDREGYVTSEHPQADFARLMKTAFETAKAVDPRATVLGVNSTTGGPGGGNIGGAEWTRGIVEAGGLTSCDAICYHCYAGGKLAWPGDQVEKGFATATGPIVEKLGRLDRPVWMTEGSAARELVGSGMYRVTVPGQGPEACIESADRLCRYVVSLLGAGCSKVFLYSMHCHTWFGSSSDFAVLMTPEGYLHPMAAGHAAMAWELEDTRFARRIEVARDVFAYLFAGRGRSVAVLAPKPGHAEYKLPAAGRDLFGNPLPRGQAVGDTLVYVPADGPAEELEKLLGPPH